MEMMRMMKKLEAAGDIDVRNTKYGYVVTINDFDGFDDDWNEVDREFVLPDLLDKLLDMLASEAYEIAEDGLCKIYRFEDFYVRVEYESYDI